MTPEQITELIPDTDQNSFVTGAILITRTTNMDTGDTELHITSSTDTDHITQVGMLTLATDLTRTPCDHDD